MTIIKMYLSLTYNVEWLKQANMHSRVLLFVHVCIVKMSLLV